MLKLDAKLNQRLKLTMDEEWNAKVLFVPMRVRKLVLRQLNKDRGCRFSFEVLVKQAKLMDS